MRAEGRKRYIWKRWVLQYGLFMALTISLFNTGLEALFEGTPFDFEYLLRQLLFGLVVFTLAGYGIGAWVWSNSEKRYQRERGKFDKPAMQ